ncbi:hypothetical protein TraAM80_03202 [Trypanosoma rangeli]|uniref:Uncharacterized protein n=1 Tax=Trypanosoma rangeli TaxID=5698 RepID=A0A3R7MKU7_TRYRA|nr:uncharacterized protein TraAM80_03202 [Trypanosoma rangeli]RNF07680.1 hypothetical protein TraAM80_03202 [Trypanosoma rangeli]|eukprot:RNF07680.1 hypothetical protein TraAM80_03202 [Trypanosoma rangeli]
MTMESSDAVEKVRMTNFLIPLEEEGRLHGEFLSCLQCKFDEAYSLALEQLKHQHWNDCGEPTSDQLAYSRERQVIYQEEIRQLRQKLEAEFQEERRQQRRCAYQRWAQVLSAWQREKKTEYQRALAYYYDHYEGERLAPRIFSKCDDALRTNLGLEEEAAMRSPAAAMVKDQVVCLRDVLRRLKREVKKASEHAQCCLLQRDVYVSAARARVQQQYLGIVAEQQKELKMLQHWSMEMRRLELDAEERIATWEERCRRRSERIQCEKGEQLSFCTCSGGVDVARKAETAADVGSPIRFRKGLFDFLL